MSAGMRPAGEAAVVHAAGVVFVDVVGEVAFESGSGRGDSGRRPVLALAQIWWDIARDETRRDSDRLEASRLVAERGWGKAPACAAIEEGDPLGLADVEKTAEAFRAKIMRLCGSNGVGRGVRPRDRLGESLRGTCPEEALPPLCISGSQPSPRGGQYPVSQGHPPPWISARLAP
jgi:hypothetical protein